MWDCERSQIDTHKVKSAGKDNGAWLAWSQNLLGFFPPQIYANVQKHMPLALINEFQNHTHDIINRCQLGAKSLLFWISWIIDLGTNIYILSHWIYSVIHLIGPLN